VTSVEQKNQVIVNVFRAPLHLERRSVAPVIENCRKKLDQGSTGAKPFPPSTSCKAFSTQFVLQCSFLSSSIRVPTMDNIDIHPNPANLQGYYPQPRVSWHILPNAHPPRLDWLTLTPHLNLPDHQSRTHPGPISSFNGRQDMSIQSRHVRSEVCSQSQF